MVLDTSENKSQQKSKAWSTKKKRAFWAESVFLKTENVSRKGLHSDSSFVSPHSSSLRFSPHYAKSINLYRVLKFSFLSKAEGFRVKCSIQKFVD